jgi:hypothetical protein
LRSDPPSFEERKAGSGQAGLVSAPGTPRGHPRLPSTGPFGSFLALGEGHPLGWSSQGRAQPSSPSTRISTGKRLGNELALAEAGLPKQRLQWVERPRSAASGPAKSASDGPNFDEQAPYGANPFSGRKIFSLFAGTGLPQDLPPMPTTEVTGLKRDDLQVC